MLTTLLQGQFFGRLIFDRSQLSLRVSISMAPPELITGGCLCNGVRYEVKFGPKHDWKKAVSG
jgi:hypothetical protein